MPYDKSNKQIQDSAFKMRAGKMGPMQKNFGASLAINKKLDKDNMAGGLTGKPSTGELDGPLAKKKGGIAPTNKTATTRKKNAGKLGGKAKRDSILSDTNNDGNMITRGFAKAKANRKAAKAKSTAKKNNKANAVVNNAKTEQKIKKKTGLAVNKNLMDKKVESKPDTKLTRKQQYDKKNWKYDDTIKGYNRDGTQKTVDKNKGNKNKGRRAS